ncbi:hypothetical protein FRC01_006331 [Tulasnella sp. 417]|nr:hypothetical protein FRC01_006331 [Tulasnella sp. 417]
MDDLHEVYEQLNGPLYGRHAPASERIIWHSTSDSDAKTKKMNNFMSQVDLEQVGQYAVEKYCGFGRGAVAFNMNFPVLQAGGFAQFLWAPLEIIRKSDDDRLIDIVSTYDPTRQFVVMYLLPSADRLTVDIWTTTLLCTFPPFIVAQIKAASIEHERSDKLSSKRR